MIHIDPTKSSLRQKADIAKIGICKYLIAVLEEPSDPKNIGTVIRNVNALGVEKLYIVDSKNVIPTSWESMRNNKTLLKSSVSAIKWSFVKQFKTTAECFEHLEKNGYTSVVTSPHIKGKINVILQMGILHKINWRFGLVTKQEVSAILPSKEAQPAFK